MFKRIALWGGWNRNCGDLVINLSTKQMLQKYSDNILEFTDINSDLMANPGFENAPAPELSIEIVEWLNKTHSALIIAGGGQLMSRSLNESKSGWQFNCSLEALKALKIPLIIMPIGYNKFPYEEDFLNVAETKHHLQETFAKAKLYSCRNNGTADVLSGLGISAVPVVSDLAMFAKGEDVQFKTVKDDDFVVGINFAGDNINKRFKDPADYHWLILKTLKLAGSLLAKTGGGKIIYYGNVSYWDLSIVPKLESLSAGLLTSLHREIPWLYPESLVTTPWAVGAYKRPDVMIGMRSHSNIIAFGQGVPSYGIGEQDKVKYFQESIGGLHLGNDPELYADVIYDRVVTNKVLTQKKLAEKKAELEVTAIDFVKRIISVI